MAVSSAAAWDFSTVGHSAESLESCLADKWDFVRAEKSAAVKDFYWVEKLVALLADCLTASRALVRVARLADVSVDLKAVMRAVCWVVMSVVS